MDYEERVKKLNYILYNELTDEERRILLLDIENDTEGRDAILSQIGRKTDNTKHPFIRGLKEKVIKLMNDDYYKIEVYKDGKLFKKFKNVADASKEMRLRYGEIWSGIMDKKEVRGYFFKEL